MEGRTNSCSEILKYHSHHNTEIWNKNIKPRCRIQNVALTQSLHYFPLMSHYWLIDTEVMTCYMQSAFCLVTDNLGFPEWTGTGICRHAGVLPEGKIVLDLPDVWCNVDTVF